LISLDFLPNVAPLLSIPPRPFNCAGIAISYLHTTTAPAALLEAAEQFHSNNHEHFAAYAAPFVEAAILRAATQQGLLISIPPSILKSLGKIDQTVSLIQNATGQTPTHLQIAEWLSLPLGDIDDLMAVPRDQICLDAPADAGTPSLRDSICDEHTPQPDDAAETLALARIAARLLIFLKPREERLPRLHFGFSGRYPVTLEDIARDFSIVRQRAQSIEAAALFKLKKYRRPLGDVFSSSC
jgi:RNA polymerase primary sigma factor